MKRLSILFCALLLIFGFADLASAQFPRTRVSPAGDLVTIEVGSLRAASTTQCYDVSSYASTVHTLTFSYATQPTGVTVTFNGSNDDCATVTSIGTSTSTTGATIQGTGAYKQFQIVISGLTGSIDVRPVYRGVGAYSSAPLGAVTVTSGTITANQGTAGSAAWLTQMTPNAAYPTAYAGLTDVVLSTTSGTVGTATTVLIGTLYCMNQTASAATMMVTNTAGTYIVGGAAGFSIPANSDVTRNFTAGKLAVGIKWWSGTATAILCSVTGWQ